MTTNCVKNPYKEVITFDDFSTVLNNIAKEKRIVLLPTEELANATSSDEFMSIWLKIYHLVVQRGYDLYFAESVNICKILLEKKEITKEITSLPIYKETFKIVEQAVKNLSPPKDEFYPYEASTAPINIRNLLAIKTQELSKMFGFLNSDSRFALGIFN